MSNSLEITEHLIERWIRLYHEKYGKYPNVQSGVVECEKKYGYFLWSTVDRSYLNAGRRGLLSGSSLAKFVADRFNVVNRTNQKNIDENLVKHWIENYHTEHGRYPNTANHSKVPCAEDYGIFSWSSLNGFLEAGLRGLPGGSSLSKFVASNFEKFGWNDPKERRVNQDDLSLYFIKRCVAEYYKKNNKYPRINSGVVKCDKKYGKLTWSKINSALTVGSRGLLGGSSLLTFIKETFVKDKINDELVLNLVRDFYIKNNKYPSSMSGPINGYCHRDGEFTWSYVNEYFRKKKTSLPRFIADNLNVINSTNKEDFTIDFIRKLVDEYYIKHNKYPTARSGLIECDIKYGKVTWRTINNCFRNQSRGLIGYNSLYQFMGGSDDKHYIHDSFEKARNFVHLLGLKNKDEWIDYCESGEKPATIPSAPQKVYEEWQGWGDWLGTGRIANQTISNIRKEKLKKDIESIQDCLAALSPQLKTIIWNYVISQNGAIKYANVLRKFENRKISLDDLVDTIDAGQDDDSDDIDLFKSYKIDVAKTLKALQSPFFAGLDHEVVEAIKCEVEDQIWKEVYQMKNEEQAIRKLKSLVEHGFNN